MLMGRVLCLSNFRAVWGSYGHATRNQVVAKLVMCFAAACKITFLSVPLFEGLVYVSGDILWDTVFNTLKKA